MVSARHLQNDGGIVVSSIDTGEYSDDHPEAQWGYLEKCVMVDFPSCGLIHYEESEPVLQLIARAARKSKKQFAALKEQEKELEENR